MAGHRARDHGCVSSSGDNHSSRSDRNGNSCGGSSSGDGARESERERETRGTGERCVRRGESDNGEREREPEAGHRGLGGWCSGWWHCHLGQAGQPAGALKAGVSEPAH